MAGLALCYLPSILYITPSRLSLALLASGIAYLRAQPRWAWIPTAMGGAHGLFFAVMGLANLHDRHGAGILILGMALPGLAFLGIGLRFLYRRRGAGAGSFAPGTPGIHQRPS